ncbi:hypothetical protein BCR36DRAFT_283782 [Piromyces finnis]|uniref:Peptidase A2 domain-containing protein n=1 Tax=Piromyces finnis TaxID=1754191 RepID=A0A1Y1VFL2_9FUNG|nr:hypothetical protein BCR36DRAFT_283782 [Piromyces finnis]|eukprot:ORX53741.1 hypothetical protein BCR36DRAFT_283782 [Piromyces finnis]
MEEDTFNRKFVNPHSRSRSPSKNSDVDQNSPNKLTNNLNNNNSNSKNLFSNNLNNDNVNNNNVNEINVNDNNVYNNVTNNEIINKNSNISNTNNSINTNSNIDNSKLVQNINNKVRFKDPPVSPDHNNKSDVHMTSPKIRKDRHTILVNKNNIEPYNIEKDLANTKCNISFAQILDICPKLRSELTKNLKLEKLKFVNSMYFNDDFNFYNNNITAHNAKFKNDDLGIVLASVDNIKNKLLIDSGSNLNLVTTKYFNKLPGQYDTVGVCRGKIGEALGDDTISNAIVVRLPIVINSYSFIANFCVIEHDAAYFDILISLKTIADNYLFINPVSKTVCRCTSPDSFEVLAPIVEDQDAEIVTCFIKFLSPHKNIYSSKFSDELEDFSNNFSNLKVTQNENLSPSDYIHSENFISELDPQYRDIIINSLNDNIDVIATSSEQLSPSDLNPHRIEL